MGDADFHLPGNNINRRNDSVLDSSVELANVTKSEPSGSSSDSPHYPIQEPFVGAHNAKKYNVEWHEPEHGIKALKNDPIISDITGWLRSQKQQ